MRNKVLILMALLSASCSIDAPSSMTVYNGDGLSKTLFCEISPYDDGQTKGMLDSAAEKISDYNVLTYDSAGRLVPSCSMYDNKEPVLTFPEDGTYTIYVIANSGNLSDSYPSEESEMSDFCFPVPEYSTMATAGLPMAGSVEVETEGAEFISVELQRLFTKLSVRFNKDLVDEEYRENTFVKTFGIRQAAKEIYPFAAGGSEATIATSGDEWGDCADVEDVRRVNSGGMATLYVPTNMQGVLLDEDNAQWDKTPEEVENQGYISSMLKMPLLTYLEMHCQVEDGSATYSDVVFRHYIGGSATSGPDNYNCSFNIYPGTTREMALTLSGGDVIKEVWRLEPYSPEWKECALMLTPMQTHMLAAAADPNISGSGATSSIRVIHHWNVQYSISVNSSSSSLKYRKTKKSSTEDIVEFYCDSYVTNSYLLPCMEGDVEKEDLNNTIYEVPVTFTSIDGTLSKTTKVYCLKSAMGCYYTLDADGVVVSVNNLLGLTFDCSLSALIKSEYGTTSDIAAAANPFTFSVKPEFRKEDDLFEESTSCTGYFATGTFISGLFDVYGELTGARANLEITCREYPGLVLKYGAGPLIYHSKESAGLIENFKPLRMSYPFEGERYYVGGRGIGTGKKLPDYLRYNSLQYYVNGEPDFVVK